MDINENLGRIPVYVKVIPRGDISSLRADTSTLELMTVNIYFNRKTPCLRGRSNKQKKIFLILDPFRKFFMQKFTLLEN